MGTAGGSGGRGRRVLLVLIAFASVLGGVGGQFLPRGVLDVRTASTAQLAGLMGLLVLPALTMWAMVLDRRWRPRVRPSLHLTQLSPDPLSPAIIEHKPMRVVSAVREPAASQRAA